MTRTGVTLSFCLVCCARMPLRAAAEDAPAQSAASAEQATRDEATRLFSEGRTLLEQRQLTAASERFEQSQALVPSIAALLNLGLCSRLRDRLASAHTYYVRAEQLAASDGDAERRDLAHDEAAKLESQVATLTLRVSARASDPVEIRIDAALQSRETWQQPIALDSGQHLVTMRVRGRETWQAGVELQNGARQVLVIPEPMLSEAPASADKPAPIAPALVAAKAAATQNNDSPRPQGIVGLAIAGAGVAALGVSLVYVLLARDAYAESNQKACSKMDVCDDSGREQRNTARAYAGRATGFAVAGALSVLGGAALWLLAPSGSPQSGQARLGVLANPTTLGLRLETSL